MSFVQPVPRRSRVHREHGVLHVEIPLRKKPLVLLLLFVFLGAWTSPAMMVAPALLRPEAPGAPHGPVILWLCAWALGAGVMLTIVVGMIFGKELVQLSRRRLVIRFAALGVGFTRAYDPAHVTRLRTLEAPAWSPGRRPDVLDMRTSIAFDHGARTVRFGRGLDEAEAALVVQELVATGAFPRFDEGR